MDNDNQLPPAPVAEEEEEEMECATCHNDGLYCNVCGYDPDGSTQPAVPVEEEHIWGKDCPRGMVQVEFVGCKPANRQGDYGWRPEKSAFLEIYVDGQRYRIDVGTYVSHAGHRRGLHICGPHTLQVDKHSCNALDVFIPADEEAQGNGEPVYTHPQPAVPDVDALAEFIRDIDDGEYIPYHEFAQRICNWIEEQNR